MVQNKFLVALSVSSGFQAYLAQHVQQQDDADVLSLLQTKAVVSRKAQDEARVKTDIENEWGLGGMLSSVVEAVHGAFQSSPRPVDDKQALQLMEAEKTVVFANTTARGVLHLVHGCHQCGFHFCDKASIKESKAGIEESYLVGSALSEWGCDKVVNPYVVHDKGTRKVYAVEFIEAHSEETSAIKKHTEAKAADSKKETSEEKTHKIGVKDTTKSKGKDESHLSEAEAKSVHTTTKAEKSSVATSADSTRKSDSTIESKWPDFSLPHLEATDKTKQVHRTASTQKHSEEKHSKSGTRSADEEKTKLDKDGGQVKQSSHKSAVSTMGTVKQTKSKEKQSKSSSNASNSADIKETNRDNVSAKSVKSEKLATEANHGSMFMEHGVAIAEKDNLPKMKIPDVIEEVVQKAGEKFNGRVFEDKKSMHTKESRLTADSMEDEEDKQEEHSRAKKGKLVKSVEHEPKLTQHPHDSMLIEHGEAAAEKYDLPNLKIPNVIQKLAETAEEKMTKKVSQGKSVVRDQTTAHTKDSKDVKKELQSSSKSAKSTDKRSETNADSSKLAASTDNTVERRHAHKEVKTKHSSARSTMSDKHHPEASNHKTRASPSNKDHTTK